jgi:hypothetical protein
MVSFTIVELSKVFRVGFNTKKQKCFAYPQEDFLVIILYEGLRKKARKSEKT